MKKVLLLIAGITTAIAYVLILRPNQKPATKPVEELAHKLQDAWADHHTVA